MIPLASIATPTLIGDRPAELLVTLAIVSLVPIALMTLTCFLKIVVVLSLTRTALGAPQIPPSTAITGLALLLTFLAMGPVAEECWRKASAVPRSCHTFALAGNITIDCVVETWSPPRSRS